MTPPEIHSLEMEAEIASHHASAAKARAAIAALEYQRHMLAAPPWLADTSSRRVWPYVILALLFGLVVVGNMADGDDGGHRVVTGDHRSVVGPEAARFGTARTLREGD